MYKPDWAAWFSSDGERRKSDEEETDSIRRITSATIIGDDPQSPLSPSHCAICWEFEGGETRVTEFRGHDADGGPGQTFEWQYQKVQEGGLPDLMKEKGFKKLKEVEFNTSPTEVYEKMKSYTTLSPRSYQDAAYSDQGSVSALLRAVAYYARAPLRIYAVVGPPVDTARIAAGSTAIVTTALVVVRCVLPLESVLSRVEIVETSSLALGTLGPALGSVTVITAGVDTSFAIHSLMQGHATIESCNALGARIEESRWVYQAEAPVEELQSAAKDAILMDLSDHMRVLGELKESIEQHHIAANTTRICGNILSAASGACFIAAPFTCGLTFVVGVGLSAGALAAGLSYQVATSCKGYEYRSRLHALADKMIDSQKKYHRSTGRCGVGLLGTPGWFRFSVKGYWCQFYMTVAYTTRDGRRMCKMSCDQGCYNWYGGVLTIEPGARDVSVTFDVRGGRAVFAVDREQANMPWIFPARREEFRFSCGDGVRADFCLTGTSLHAYVVQANWLSGFPAGFGGMRIALTGLPQWRGDDPTAASSPGDLLSSLGLGSSDAA